MPILSIGTPLAVPLADSDLRGTVMSTSSIQSPAGNPIQELAARITKKLDVDGDGNLSTVEFSNFLTQFLGALTQPLGTGSSTTETSSSTSGPAADRKAVGTMAGFDSGKLANTSHDSSKYTIGRI